MLSQASKYFQQAEPNLKGHNLVDEDVAMQQLLTRVLPKDAYAKIYKDLRPFGLRVTTDIQDLDERANLPHNYPKFIQINGWGKRVDEIQMCPEWKALHDVAASEGIIALGYDRSSLGQFARVHQMVKLYYFTPVSALVSCPLAMTDGAVRLIEQIRKEKAQVGASYSYPPFLDTVYERLTSRDPNRFWTSGQWMTERAGGSDVSQTETAAELISGNRYKLTGYKYFTSATTADVAFTLARVNNVPGSKGLSLFVLKLRNDEGKLNNMMVHKLKDKMGTKTLPTAEMELLGTEAELIGEIGKGVRTISHLFNITRLWTASSSAALMHRLLALLRDFSAKRVVFGKLLSHQPAHLLTVSRLEVESRACLHLFIKMALLLGEDEHLQNPKSSALLRLLTPVCKLFSAKQAMEFAQEGLELFGSPGYMEDTGLPRVIRDAQVNSIWEGTTNILSLDVLRVFNHEQTALKALASDVLDRIKGNAISELDSQCKQVKESIEAVANYFPSSLSSAEFSARDLAFTIARTYTASLLIEHANWSKNPEDIYTAQFWCAQKPLSYLNFSPYEPDQQTVVTKLARL